MKRTFHLAALVSALSLAMLLGSCEKDSNGGSPNATATVVTVNDLMDWLATRSAKHGAAFANRATIKSAVDQTHVPLSAALGDAREVAFFPPVTGG